MRGVRAGVLARGGAPLGRWLTAGYRRLDLVVVGVPSLVAYVALLLAALFLSSFGASQRAPSSLELAPMQAAIATAAPLQGSASLFVTLALATTWLVAGATAILGLFGPQRSRHMPSLRGPLDMALDIDNDVREFPRIDIPRARIFSRFAALLCHVRGGGYDRIVVVSHSQGTVIAADLQRFLSSRELRAPAPEGRPHVDGQPLPPISLLTAGCPAPGPVVAASGTRRRNDGGIAARPVQVLVGCQTMTPPKPGDRFAAAAVLLCSMPAAGCAHERSRASYNALISRVTSSITTSIRFGCRRRRA